MKFKVKIVETYTYRRDVEIEAADEDEAYAMISEKVENGDIEMPCGVGEYERTLFVK